MNLMKVYEVVVFMAFFLRGCIGFMNFGIWLTSLRFINWKDGLYDK